MFSDIIKLQQNLAEHIKRSNYKGIMIGKVCHLRNDDRAVRVIRLDDASSYVSWWLKPSSIANNIDTQIGDLVLYCYPTLDPKSGIYIDLLDKEVTVGGGGVSEAYVTNRINTYDTQIKGYISGLNYVTLAAVQSYIGTLGYVTSTDMQSYVTGLGYVTLAAVQSYVSGLGYTTMTAVQTYISGLNLASQQWVNDNFIDNAELTAALSGYVTNANITSTIQTALVQRGFRYIANNFVQASKNASIDLPDSWLNRHLNILCSGSVLPATGGTQETGAANTITINISATNHPRIAIGDQVYFRINTTASINIIALSGSGATIQGVNNSAFNMPMRSCWRLEKATSTNYTLNNMNNFDFTPY